MSVTIVPVVVPVTGDGPLADVSAVVGPKTVQLAGSFRGSYALLASQDDLNFVPVASFDAGNPESFKQTIPGAFKSVLLRSKATNAVGVTCDVSGITGAGENFFTTVATVPAGFSGLTPVVDLSTSITPNGPEEDTCYLCRGSFQGPVTVLGSLDGTNFNPVGSFNVGRVPEGAPSVVDLSPLSSLDKVRYVRLLFAGATLGDVTVTVGSRVPASGSAGTPMAAYVALGGTVFQALGSIVVTGSVGSNCVVAGAGASAPAALASNAVVLGVGATGLQSSCVVLGVGTNCSSGGSNGVAIGTGAASANASVNAIGIGTSARAGNTAQADGSAAIGLSSQTNSAQALAIGVSASVGQNSANSAAIGTGATVNANSPTCFVAGNGASSSAASCVVVGPGSSSTASASVVLGTSSQAQGGSNNVAIGNTAVTANNSARSVVIGRSSTAGSGAQADDSVVIGSSCRTSSANTVAIGSSITVDDLGVADHTTAVGTGITIATNCTYTTVVGATNSVGSDCSTSVVVGSLHVLGSTTPSSAAVLIGTGNSAEGINNLLVGSNAHTDSAQTNLIGHSLDVYGSGHIGIGDIVTIGFLGDPCLGCIAIGGGVAIGHPGFVQNAVSIGNSSRVRGDNGVALGRGAVVGTGHSNSVAIGNGATTTAAGEVVFGSTAVGNITRFRAVGATLDLLKFDLATAAVALDTAMSLLYKDSGGTLVMNPVTVEAVTGYLKVAP